MKPERIFMSVLFPAPFSPRIPWMEEEGTSREIPAFAWTWPKVLWMLAQLDLHGQLLSRP